MILMFMNMVKIKKSGQQMMTIIITVQMLLNLGSQDITLPGTQIGTHPQKRE